MTFVATIKVLPIFRKHDAGLAAVKVWPGGSEFDAGRSRRPTLTAAAHGVVQAEGQDEETAA
ncbi:hypothetical protein [Bradyrhizobium sp. 192]|uniref:hypothetical protein n=1 Tax=Bradyrhizobium sp. 192 TaxID=2782660 RepID=UPI002000598E|nr:hypothetical protein [Bradyrhizobium sp. 192]UPJ60920.1 hypothetical protein IVB24_15525 [Bradyrhizobium sp. 192]